MAAGAGAYGAAVATCAGVNWAKANVDQRGLYAYSKGNDMYGEDRQFDNAREFVNFFLTDKRFRTNNPFAANQVGQSGFIFRGQSCANWALTPTAFRPDTPMRDFTAQPAGTLTDSTNLHQQLGSHLKSEERAVFLFLKNADSVGISTR